MIALADILFGTLVAVNATDFMTRPESVLHETNPRARLLYDKPILLASAKLTVGVVLPELGARYLEKKNKKTFATILRIAAIVGPAYGTYTNIKGRVRRNEPLF